MKFLVIGLGSMGKRRVRCLKMIGGHDIIGFELREDRRNEAREKYGIKVYGDMDEAMKESPDALIISTPPNVHTKYALMAAEKNKHFFTEASVVSEGMEELIKKCRGKKIIAAPSCTFRYFPQVRKLREIIDGGSLGKPLTFSYHFGLYLPYWHPWENYKDFYASKRETSAAREMTPFELVWLTWLFGGVEKVSCFKGKLSDLDVDIDDVYHIILKFRGNIMGHMHIDAVSRLLHRSLQVFCEKGVIFWEWGDGVKDIIRVYNDTEKKWTSHTEFEKRDGQLQGADERIFEKPYVEELQAFIDAIKGKKPYPYTLEEDLTVLRILEASERSSERGTHEKV